MWTAQIVLGCFPPGGIFRAQRNFPRAAEFFFVCELSGRTNRKKTKKICAAHGNPPPPGGKQP